MALTQATAAQAGQMSAELAQLNAGLAAAQAAVADSMQITGINALASANGTIAPLSVSYTFSAADSATLLNQIITVIQSNITTLTTALAQM